MEDVDAEHCENGILRIQDHRNETEQETLQSISPDTFYAASLQSDH